MLLQQQIKKITDIKGNEIMINKNGIELSEDQKKKLDEIMNPTNGPFFNEYLVKKLYYIRYDYYEKKPMSLGQIRNFYKQKFIFRNLSNLFKKDYGASLLCLKYPSRLYLDIAK